MAIPVSPNNQKSQVDKFRDLARELEADEDPARFEKTVGKIAPSARRTPVGDAHDKHANTGSEPGD